MTVLFLMTLTLREASRRRLVWVGLGLGLAFVALFGIGFSVLYREIESSLLPLGREATEGASFFTIAGLYALNFLVVMLSVLVAADVVSGEIASGAIQTLATKPVRRFELILGKWLGLALLVVSYVLLVGGGILAVSWVVSGYLVPNSARGLGLIALEGVALVSLAVLGGTRLSTITNGAFVFMLYGLAFLGGWTEQIGGILRNQAAINVGIVSSLLMPSEALWKRAAYLMQPAAFQQFAATPFAITSVPSQAMVVYAVLYAAVAVALAVRTFGRRDL